MRACLFAFALVIGAVAYDSSARAGCWPNENFHVVCWLDTMGHGCAAHHALTSAKAVLHPEPRFSFYEFETVHWFTSGPSTACPPSQTVKFTGHWDRETGKAEETVSNGWSTWTRYIYCSHNPWTGQGPDKVPICSVPAGDPNAGLPFTAAMLSQSQKYDLLHNQEPLHTRCQQISPPEDSGWLSAKGIVEVVASHHEFQKLAWHLLFKDLQEFGPWQEVAAPKPPKVILISQGTKYTERRVATSRRKFWLNKPGRWLVVAEPKPISTAAQQASTATSNDCPAVHFIVQ